MDRDRGKLRRSIGIGSLFHESNYTNIIKKKYKGEHSVSTNQRIALRHQSYAGQQMHPLEAQDQLQEVCIISMTTLCTERVFCLPQNGVENIVVILSGEVRYLGK